MVVTLIGEEEDGQTVYDGGPDDLAKIVSSLLNINLHQRQRFPYNSFQVIKENEQYFIMCAENPDKINISELQLKSASEMNNMLNTWLRGLQHGLTVGPLLSFKTSDSSDHIKISLTSFLYTLERDYQETIEEINHSFVGLNQPRTGLTLCGMFAISLALGGAAVTAYNYFSSDDSTGPSL